MMSTLKHISLSLSFSPSLSLELTFASLNALDPCMISICVASISTVLEPSTTASATAALTGFLDSTALGAYGNGYC